MSRLGFTSWKKSLCGIAAAMVLAGAVWPLAAQHRAKLPAHASHGPAHAPSKARSRSPAGMTTKRATTGKAVARTRAGAHATSRGYSRTSSRASARSHAGYGTGARTSYRATVDPESRLDLLAGLAETLAHGASAIRYPAALASVYGALAADSDPSDPSAQPASLPVRVLQFGDSHTAADMFTGEARRVFQGQFGNGGVGFTYPGHPFAGYRILGSSRSQSGGWQTLGTHFTDLGDAMTGMGGVAIQTYRPGEWISEEAPCTSFEVQYLQEPGGGSLQVTDNGVAVGQIDTSAPGTGYPVGAPNPTPGSGQGFGAGSWRYDCPSSRGYAYLPHRFVVTTLANAPVRLLGTVALQPGATWESIGINGAEAPLILKWNQPLFTNYLSQTAASLIVLAYGTNEAAASWTYEGYTEVFTRLIERLHATLPKAAILVLGPTDRSTAARRRGYAPFAGTERILEAQREVCRTHGCAFWDAQARMGGFGSMQRWVLAGWAQPDHTHLTGEGYRTLADALLADLLSGYDVYRAAHGLPSMPLRGTGVGAYGQGSSAPLAMPPGPSPQAPPQ